MSMRLSELDGLADEALGTVNVEAPSFDVVTGRARQRQRQRRAVSGAGLACVAALLSLGAWWSLQQIVDQRQVVDTVDQVDDEDGAGLTGAQRRGSFIWPFPAQGFESPPVVIDQFAADVLGWADTDYDVITQSTGTFETTDRPFTAKLTDRTVSYSIEILVVPSEAGWGIVQMDSSDGTDILGITEGPPYRADIQLGQVPDGAAIHTITNLASGRVLTATHKVAQPAGGDFAGYPLDEEGIAGFGDIVSLLVVVESDGEVIAVTGGQFSSDDEEEATAAEQEAAAAAIDGSLDDGQVGPPSQSLEHALRDGVIPDLARIPHVDRVESETLADQAVAETDEGVWLISRRRDLLADDCILGDGDGEYGTDFICTFDYTEILLFDSVGRSIIKAYPMPSLHVTELLVTDEAIYCRRVGDGGSPDSILCRIDRETGEMTVRLFPHPSTVDAGDASWVLEIDYPFDVAVGQEIAHITGSLEFNDGKLLVRDPDTTVVFDAVTLEVLSTELEG